MQTVHDKRSQIGHTRDYEIRTHRLVSHKWILRVSSSNLIPWPEPCKYLCIRQLFFLMVLNFANIAGILEWTREKKLSLAPSKLTVDFFANENGEVYELASGNFLVIPPHRRPILMRCCWWHTMGNVGVSLQRLIICIMRIQKLRSFYIRFFNRSFCLLLIGVKIPTRITSSSVSMRADFADGRTGERTLRLFPVRSRSWKNRIQFPVIFTLLMKYAYLHLDCCELF